MLFNDEFMLMLGENIFNANPQDAVNRQQEDRADAAFLVEEVPWDKVSRYGVCDTNMYGEITEVIEKPDDLPSNLMMTGFYTFSPAVFHTCYMVQPSDQDEYEILRCYRPPPALGTNGRCDPNEWLAKRYRLL